MSHSQKQYWKDPEKWRKYHLARYHKIPKDTMKRTNLWKNHRMTLEEWNELFEKQEGKCALCRRSGVKLQVDHDHKTNKRRGLLCSTCNGRIVGALETYHIPARRVMDYLCES